LYLDGPAGIYFLQITDEQKKSKTIKIIKSEY